MKTKKLKFNADCYYAGELVFRAGEVKEVSTELGWADRWLRRGAVEVSEEIPSSVGEKVKEPEVEKAAEPEIEKVEEKVEVEKAVDLMETESAEPLKTQKSRKAKLAKTSEEEL